MYHAKIGICTTKPKQTVACNCVRAFGHTPYPRITKNLKSMRRVCAARTRSSKLLLVTNHPKRSSETHFQTTFCHFAKQEFPLPSPQTSPEPVNFPYFKNFLEANHAPYPSAPPVPAPHRRTRPVVFSAGQGSRCPKNFRRALSGGGVRFGKLFGMAEAG